MNTDGNPKWEDFSCVTPLPRDKPNQQQMRAAQPKQGQAQQSDVATEPEDWELGSGKQRPTF